MTPKSRFLTARSRDVLNELALHPVLSKHWDKVSVIMKGSTARGNADRYSDIDLVLYTDERTYRAIVQGYYRAGLTKRRDGIFMFFAGSGYDGHYHVESWNQLKRYYGEQDFIHAWEYQTVVRLHDPGDCFEKTVQTGMRVLFADPLRHVRQQYLQLQLDLDWMRHPLRRGDEMSSFLHCATLVRGLCRISYLLDTCPFPPDKWLAHYLRGTRFGRKHATDIRRYTFSSAGAEGLTRHLELSAYPLYVNAAELIKQVGAFIRQHYGDCAWIDEWYFYV
jgi:predicted nucleotidyltransferase